jgi:hypothetical protein
MVCDGLNCGLICGIRNPKSDLCAEYRKRIAEELKPSQIAPCKHKWEVLYSACEITEYKCSICGARDDSW